MPSNPPAAACLLSAVLAAWESCRSVPQSPEVAGHLAAARAAAGEDLRPWLALGQAAMPTSAPSPSIEALMAQPAPPPGKAFDNLAFVGAKWVSAWALITSDGIILLDALNNEDEAER